MTAVSLALLAIIPLSSYANNELAQPNSPMPASEQYQQQYQQHHQAASGGHYAKNFNVRFLGSGIFNEFIGASIDFQINTAMTAGPMAKGFISNSNSGYLVGFDAIYATNGNVFSTGWIISPYIGFTSSDYKQKTKKSSAVIGIKMPFQKKYDDSD